jgi:hypothetical protein
MLYTGNFEDPHLAMMDIVSHAGVFAVDVVSITVDSGSILVVETVGAFPADQLDHIGLTEVA